jgi:cobyric acid synthase CobQ/L-threonine-O-3-phosphate decarboxylase
MDNAHGGNLRELARAAHRPAEAILDFSANLNPLGPPEWLRSLISSQVSALVHYPDPECAALVEAIADRYGTTTEEILVGNGSVELLYLLPRALEASRAVVPVPSYSDYVRAAEAAGLAVERVVLREDQGLAVDLRALRGRLRGGEMVFIGQPNNPTGLLCDAEALRELAGEWPATTFVVDEAFGGFVEGGDSLITRRPANVVVLCSMTKLYAIPGLRLGFAVAEPEVVQRVRRIRPPWSVNSLAQAVGRAAVEDREYAERSQVFVREQRARLQEELSAIPGLTPYPGRANFLLVRLDRPGLTAAALASRLLVSDGIAIRGCENFEGLDERYFRVAVRTAEENERLGEALRAALGGRPAAARKRRTPALMFQGTSSNAGKSVLAAALCRILLQDGYRVAPFKAQNMSLNSYVTREGGEMGRAQVVQAQACKIDPDVRMNPILLKPNSDTGSQVIVRGQPVGNMNVEEFIRYKPQAFQAATAAYESLAAEYDVIVLEGAGSPAEVNLKHHDIVNMAMARHAGAPVLLVGDIDRGGVYASFVGTMEVLAEWERALVAGFVVNRFRGRQELLAPAHAYVAAHTGREVYGVVPYLHDLGLPEEDSVSFKSGRLEEAGSAPPGAVDVAVIDLPHISNFTDFDALRVEPDVHLRTVRRVEDLGTPDAVILPGSKNVIGDLTYLRESGLAERIAGLAAAGQAMIIGVCGGLQMLGRNIADPHGLESSGRSTLAGLGLLPVTTVLAQEKTLTRVSALHAESGLPVRGYEIHHGQTDCQGALPVLRREDGVIIGLGLEGGKVWGTYLHGIFDADEFRRWLVDRLRVRRGLAPLGAVCATYDLEPPLDRLAEVVRSSLRVEDIYRLMGL